MKPWLVASIALVLVVACGGAALPAGSGPAATSTPAGGTDEPVPTLPVGSLAAGRTPDPSDGLIQLANLYVPGDEAPFGLDIYHMRASPYGDFGTSYPIAGDLPIAHADFGTITDPFDPGNRGGNESWAAFRAGQPPTEDNEVWNFGSGFTAGERITEIIFSGFTDSAGHHSVADGRRYDNDPALNGATPRADGGFLIVESSGLDAVWGNSLRANYIMLGDECLDYDSSPGQPEPASIGSLSMLTAPAGTAQAVAYAREFGQPDECSGSLATDPVTVTIPNGGIGYLFLYATKKDELKSFFAPAIP